MSYSVELSQQLILVIIMLSIKHFLECDMSVLVLVPGAQLTLWHWGWWCFWQVCSLDQVKDEIVLLPYSSLRIWSFWYHRVLQSRWGRNQTFLLSYLQSAENKYATKIIHHKMFQDGSSFHMHFMNIFTLCLISFTYLFTGWTWFEGQRNVLFLLCLLWRW